MSAIRLIAIIVIVAGVAGLVLGSVSYTRTNHEAMMGPFHFAVQEKRTVNIPLWAGIGAIVAGALLLVVPKRT